MNDADPPHKGLCLPRNPSPYSISQQLVTTAWNILFAIIMVAIFFGWTGGKLLIGSSYVDAKQKAAEMRAERKQKKAED